NALQFLRELLHFGVQRGAVTRGVGGVGRLNGQLTNPLQDVAGGLQGALGGLRQRDAVVGVAAGLIEATDLRGEALGDRQAGRVVLGAVDAQTGGQALQRGRERIRRVVEVALRGQRGDVAVD